MLMIGSLPAGVDAHTNPTILFAVVIVRHIAVNAWQYAIRFIFSMLENVEAQKDVIVTITISLYAARMGRRMEINAKQDATI